MTDELPALTDQDRQLLMEFLQHQERPEGTFNYVQLQGFLYSVLCAPEYIDTEEWLPIVFNSQSANAEKQSQMQKIVVILVQHYKAVFDDIMTEQCTPPLNLNWSDDKDQRFDLEQFCQGFINGFSWLEARWKQAITKFNAIDVSLRGDTDLEQHLYAIIGLISTLSAPESNLERADNPAELTAQLPNFAQQLPDVIMALAKIGGQLEELFQTLADQENSDKH